MIESRKQYRALVDFLAELSSASIHYSLAHVRPEAVMVIAAVPGERWEVEFLLDGSVDVEVFRSDGTISDEGSFARLFALGTPGDRSPRD